VSKRFKLFGNSVLVGFFNSFLDVSLKRFQCSFFQIGDLVLLADTKHNNQFDAIDKFSQSEEASTEERDEQLKYQMVKPSVRHLLLTKR